MKRLFYCLLLIGLGSFWVQLSSQSLQLEDKVLNALSTLDQTQVPSGLLYERVPSYYPMEYFRGNYLSDTTSVLINRFSVFYGMIKQMDINAALSFPTMSQIVDTMNVHKGSDTIRLGILLCNYDRLDSESISKNLISYQADHFYDVPVRSQSPYQADTLFAMSAYNHLSHNINLKFILPDNYIHNSFGISAIEMDFDDGQGYRTVQLNELITISYLDYAIHRIKCRAVTSSGRLFVAQTIVETKPQTSGLDYNINADDSVYLSGVRLYWWYNKNCADLKIRKPLILIDGFDPLQKNGQGIVFNKYGQFNFNGLLNFKYENTNKTLSEYLHDDDYDVFFVDFKSGAAPLIENADYLIEVINWINQRKHKDGSYEKNIVVGASMGGVIGYYALKTMENVSNDHETEMYLTVDSPLKGANIPLGLQALVTSFANYKLVGTKLKNIGNQDVFNESGNKLLKGEYQVNSPAARDLLFYHYDTPGWEACAVGYDCATIEASKLGAVHDIFYPKLNALGILNIPHYAISNGSVIGKKQTFDDGALLAIDYKSTEDLVKDIFGDLSQIVEALVEIYRNSKFEATNLIFALNASPGEHPVYHGEFKTKILGIPFSTVIERRVSNAIPYDNAPGGMRRFEPGFEWNYPSFCFIPVISSLRLNTTDPYYTSIPYLDDVERVTNEGKTAISYYSGSIEEKIIYEGVQALWNENHVTFNSRLSKYIRTVVGFNFWLVANPLNNSTFNFGDPLVTKQDIKDHKKTRIRPIINYDLDIKNTGELWVNRIDRIGYTQINDNPYNRNNVTYDVNIIQECNDSTVVHVKENGKLIVGDMTLGNNIGRLLLNDSTQLQISSGGIVKVEEKSKIIVNNGAKLIINSGGILEAKAESKIIVKKDGILRIRPNGILNLTQNSELIVEAGGKIIIDEGAILKLEDGDLNQNGRCRIKIEFSGIFRYNGLWKHYGNGYVQFDFNSKLEMPIDEEFRVRGYKKHIRFIRLNTACKLQIPCQGLQIGRGTIDMEDNTGIYTTRSITLDSITVQGTINEIPDKSTAKAFYTHGGVGTKVIAYFCDFKDIESGITTEPVAKFSIESLEIKRSLFNYVDFPLVIDVCQKGFLDSVSFLNGYSSTIQYCPRMDLKHVLADNMVIAFDLLEVKHFVVRQSEFSNCEQGINATGNSNVYAYISNFVSNYYGIHVIGNSINGLTELGCCYFYNNTVSVYGDDILLSISPLSVNSGFGSVGKNKFKLANMSQMFFDVYYINRSVDQVEGSHNFWGGAAPPPGSYSFYEGFQQVPFNYDPYFTNPLLVNCDTAGGKGGNDLCQIIDVSSNLTFTQIRSSAMDQFHNGNTDVTEQQMQDISKYQTDLYNTSSSSCKFNFDYARVFTNVALANQGQQPILSDVNENKRGINNEVYPNPVDDYIFIKSNSEMAKIEVYDASGVLVQNRQPNEKNIKLDCSNLPSGVYYLRIDYKNAKKSDYNLFIKK